MENKISFINVASYAIFFMPLPGSETRDQKKIKTYISVLKEYMKYSCRREEYSEVFIYEVNEIACLVCANAKLTMGEVASLIKKGEDTPFDTFMNNETPVLSLINDEPTSKQVQPLVVIHKDDIGTIGEMGNESMPIGFDFSSYIVIAGSAM